MLEVDGRKGTPDPASLMVRFGMLSARWFYVVALGLGFSSLAVATRGGYALLFGIAGLLAWRWRRGRELFILPDCLLVCLPYFWALNATDCFQPWWEWMVPALLVVLAISLWGIVSHPSGQPPWPPRGVEQGIILAFLFLTLFSTVVWSIFPLFSWRLYAKTLVTALFFFGGIPVCQAAGRSWVLGSEPKPEDFSGVG